MTTSGRSEIGQRFPARFDPDAWETDLACSTPAGRTIAQAARSDYEPGGVPRSHLKRCEPEGRDGNNLVDCIKVYVPHPDGQWGMVFVLKFEPNGRPVLMFLAFGVRHHPRAAAAARAHPDRPVVLVTKNLYRPGERYTLIPAHTLLWALG